MALLGAVVLSACSERSDLAEDEVLLELPGRTVDLEIIDCGLDGNVFVLGAESADAFVQLLLRLDRNGERASVRLEDSAVSVETRDLGVLGAGDAALLGVAPGRPGEMTRARIRGDRIEVTADLEPLGTDGGEPAAVEVAARCSPVAELAAS